MKKEISCGAVIARQTDAGCEILLIRHANGGHWAFPKGHVEGNETEAETALREIREETGLSVTLDTNFRTVVTYSPKPGVMKDVIYFAAELTGARRRGGADHLRQRPRRARPLPRLQGRLSDASGAARLVSGRLSPGSKHTKKGVQ